MIVKSYVQEICNRIKGKRVLDIGCCATTEQNLLKRHNEYKKTASEIIGVDYNMKLLQIAEERGAQNLHYLDVTDRDDVINFLDEYGTFDTIVCTDVIEHISNPGLFLDNLQLMLSEGGTVYLTTPNMRSTRWYSMFVRGNTKINPDHVCWYDHYTLSVLLKRYKFVIAETMYHSEERKDAKYLKIDYQEWMGRRLFVVIEREEI